MKFTLILAGMLMMLGSSLHAQEEMYKWTNSAGVTQYSQFPPEGVAGSKIEKVGGKKKTAARSLRDIENSDEEDDGANDALSMDATDSDFEDENADDEEMTGEEALANAEKIAAAEKKRVEAEARKICEIATKNLIGLESRPIIRVKDGDDFRVLTRDEKAAKLTETKEQISKYCR